MWETCGSFSQTGSFDHKAHFCYNNFVILRACCTNLDIKHMMGCLPTEPGLVHGFCQRLSMIFVFGLNYIAVGLDSNL